MTIVEFLEARLAEDEQIATAAGSRAMEWRSSDDHVTGGGVPYVDYWSGGESTVRYDDETIIQDCGEGAESKHIARQDPARALAEVAAKRALVDKFKDADLGAPYTESPEVDHWDDWQVACYEVLSNLALIYCRHPDYRKEWVL